MFAQLPKLLTSKDLQNYLKLGRCKVQELLQTNQIPNFKIDGQYRVYSTDLKKWMDDLKEERGGKYNIAAGDIFKSKVG